MARLLEMSALSWEILDHVCRLGYGRLLGGTNAQGQAVVRCAECATEVAGTKPAALCACGAKLRNGRLAGLQCVPNPCPSIEQPAQIVVVYTGETKCRG